MTMLTSSTQTPHDVPDIWIATLRAKWSTVPAAGSGRTNTHDLLQLSDSDLVDFWERELTQATTGPGYSIRGWYHELYRDAFRGKRVLDIGAGLGLDALSFARHGADMTLVDISPSNVELQRRLAEVLGVRTNHLLMEDLSDLDSLDPDYDVIWAQGSLINAPFEAMRQEAAALLQHLNVGGRWIELAYPKQRWEREGRMPFDQWGCKTDGPDTPWVEWYDLGKVTRRLTPARFDVVFAMNFHDDDFNWFDLIRTA